MKKIINLKKLSVLMSLLLSVSFTNMAIAAEKVIDSEQKDTSETIEETVVETVQLNNGLRDLIQSQKDAKILLSDPSLNVDATLGELTKYSALTAVQEAKNKLEETASKSLDFQPSEITETNSVSVSNNGRKAVGKQNVKEEVVEEIVPPADIKATAVYTLGNTGYAEIIYNGSKNVVKKGDKLPNGEIVESLNPLSVVIRDGDTKKSLPIVSSGESSQPEYTLTAPKM